ncbi:hypothetical protein B0H12DRAFT_1324885 [Mycena haematopus]|nr:hypothetical protein B0H12DRAFT_1324885 [Mycena haematopus]
MPVSFPVATHHAQPFPFPDGHQTKAGEVLQFSLGNESDIDGSGRNVSDRIPNIIPNKNGFVATLLDAYTQDRALVIRPDDVWLAILCQFNFFVNARAELLLDFAEIARQMADLVEKEVVDPTLRAWATPDFTTTTLHDSTVSAVMLMATLKKYFDYTIRISGCGIPRVTLDGQKSDWVNILESLEKLKEYGLETTAWYHLLRPVITRFVGAFDDPTNPDNVDFWQRVAHHSPGRSGMGDSYTGWSTAFAVFTKEGRWMGNQLKMTVTPETVPDPVLTAARFWATYGGEYMQRDLILDGAPYHRLYRGGIPPAYGEVDVLVIDDNVRFDCAMVAGSIGTRVSSSGDRALSPCGADDTVQPILGWWFFVKDEENTEEKAEDARSRRIMALRDEENMKENAAEAQSRLRMALEFDDSDSEDF